MLDGLVNLPLILWDLDNDSRNMNNVVYDKL